MPDSGSCIPFPRGKYRAKLGQSGLIGKIRLTSTMSVSEVEEEVRSVFSKPMDNRVDFPFVFLQSTGCGSRSLTLPAVSASFSWTPHQVAKLGSGKQCMYILSKDKLVTDKIEVSILQYIYYVFKYIYIPLSRL